MAIAVRIAIFDIVVPRPTRPISMTQPIDSSSAFNSPGRRLRMAWQAKTIVIPGVFNSLVAKIAERFGYSAVYISGGALSAGSGVPDVGLLTLTEFVSEAQRISSATTLPVISDADTGFGEA